MFRCGRVPERAFKVDGWDVGGVPAHSLVWAERKGGLDGLWSGDDVQARGDEARELVEAHFGAAEDRGVSRADFTTTRWFDDPAQGRAFLAGLAALEFPRLEATRRGTPPHSVWWTGTASRRIRNRVYDKSREQGGEPWRGIRLEDQRSFAAGARPELAAIADPSFQAERFRARFAPMARAASGVRAASFPVIAQTLADEARYGYRTTREVERLAGALVILHGGASQAYPQRTLERRRRELRDAGLVVVDDFLEPVDVDLGGELERAVAEFA